MTRVWTTKSLAHEVGVSMQAVAYWAREKGLPVISVGRGYAVPTNKFEQWATKMAPEIPSIKRYLKKKQEEEPKIAEKESLFSEHEKAFIKGCLKKLMEMLEDA